ncbi:hypothetical protein D3C81_1776570 [compost metagenome]
MTGLALFHQQERSLLQRGQVATLPVAVFPFSGCARLWGLRRVTIQALLEHGVGARVGSGCAAFELFAGQVRVMA